MIDTVLQVHRMLSMALMIQCRLVMVHLSPSVVSRSTFRARQIEITKTELRLGTYLTRHSFNVSLQCSKQNDAIMSEYTLVYFTRVVN